MKLKIEKTILPILSPEGLMLKLSALKLLMVVNLCYQLSWEYQITFLYSSTDTAPQFCLELTHFNHFTQYIVKFSIGFWKLPSFFSLFSYYD